MDVNTENLKELCRICLCSTDETFVELSSEVSNSISVQSMLISLTVDDEEEEFLDHELPSKICIICFKKLTEAYEFQQSIVESRKKLLLLVKDFRNNGTDNDKKSKDNDEALKYLDQEEEDVSYEPCIEFCPVSKISSNESTDFAPLVSKNKPLVNKQKKIKVTKLSKFECGLCDKAYVDLKAFKIHFRKHTGERPYLCSFCSKTFADKSGHDKHVKRKHTEEGFKKHQCPYCPRKTSDITHLRTHIQTHTGEKPDVCQICGKAFNGRTALRMHLRIHSDEKAFKCRFCNQAFKLKKYLERHEMIHQNIKPYQCHYCQNSFTQQGDLIKHLKQHDHDTSYKCDQCDKSFRLKTELRRHMIVHPRQELVIKNK